MRAGHKAGPWPQRGVGDGLSGPGEEASPIFVMLGFLGSFTTFSSLALQTVEGLAGSPALGVISCSSSIVLGLLAAVLGLRLAWGLITLADVELYGRG